MSVYEDNLAALATRSPELAALVDAAVPYSLEPAESRAGLPTARAGGLWLHSRYDPAAEARRAVDEALGAGADLLVLLGLGLGYAAEAGLAAGIPVLAAECDPGLLRAELSVRDLAATLASDRFSLALCPDGNSLTAAMAVLDPRSIAATENQGMRAACPEALESYRNAVRACREKDGINAATLKRFGKLWVRNLARNAILAGSLPGVARLFGRFAGAPALVLAAGPSLDDVLPSLPALRERCLLVCVDTALRSVLRAGVEPDVVVVVDPQYWNARHLDGCRPLSSVLVTEAAVWPSVFDMPVRTAFLCSSLYPLGRYIEHRCGGPRGTLGAGGSVATAAWDLARSLGCSPVFMAGLDLSFPDGKTHARASLFEQRSLAAGRRLSPAATAGFEAMRGGHPYPAASNDGGTVTTDKRLSLYAWWFSNRAARHPETPTYTLSARGLAIPGLSYRAPAALLDLPLLRAQGAALDPERLDAMIAEASSGGPGDAASGSDVATVVADLVGELERLAALSDTAVSLAIEARDARGPDLEALLRELAGIDATVLSSSAKDVAGFLVGSAAEAIGGRATDLADSLGKTERIYRSVADSARWHAMMLSRSVDGTPSRVPEKRL